MLIRNCVAKVISTLKPIQNNRVVFSSFCGEGYSDSPKAVCEVLRQSGEDLDLVWLCKDEAAAKTLPQGVRAVPAGGAEQLRALASAKVWVDNCLKENAVKKKGQIYMQTWHGFALEKAQGDPAEKRSGAESEAGKRDLAQCDVIISGSGFMTKLYRDVLGYQGTILNTGTPRNDVFYGDHSAVHAKICKAFGLPEDRKLALYAPASRGDRGADAFRLDADMVCRKCEENFKGSWTALICLPADAAAPCDGLFAWNAERIVDASAYPDMQELLCAAGLLISDYSPSMFDYALTGKPVVRFATDLEAYRKGRQFYFRLDQLPFPLAGSNEELEAVLTDIQPLWTSSAWADFTRENEFCEDGQASIRCAAIILQQIKKTQVET